MATRLVAACTLALLLLAVPSQALAAIRLTRVQYDSPGTDGGSNRSLNAEWVRITNTGKSARSLSGWRLRDEGGFTYRFGTYKLRAGRSVTVHTGKGSNTRGHRYWGQSWYVWNNTGGDAATLRNRSGDLVDRCRWSVSGTTAVSC